MANGTRGVNITPIYRNGVAIITGTTYTPERCEQIAAVRFASARSATLRGNTAVASMATRIGNGWALHARRARATARVEG